MQFLILTIFPEMFTAFWEHGMVQRAIRAGLASGRAIDIRKFTHDRHRTTDDRPYGGGAGMIMTPEPLARALDAARRDAPNARTVLLTPQGRPLTQPLAEAMAVDGRDFILLCGRYEGVDERIVDSRIDLELSIGDFVLSGGEVAAMAVIDTVIRLIPGVLGNDQSAGDDSFSKPRLEHAQYTRPPVFDGRKIPEVLQSGHHGDIALWRMESALIRTALKRPDLLAQQPLSPDELQILNQWRATLDRILRPGPEPGPDPSSGS